MIGHEIQTDQKGVLVHIVHERSASRVEFHFEMSGCYGDSFQQGLCLLSSGIETAAKDHESTSHGVCVDVFVCVCLCVRMSSVRSVRWIEIG